MTVLSAGDRILTGDGPSNSDRILANPRFQELVRTRTAFGWTLSFLMLGIYLGFVLLVAFDYKLNLMGTRIGGGTTTFGILLGLAVIATAVILTGVYIGRANGHYDALTRDVTRELG